MIKFAETINEGYTLNKYNESIINDSVLENLVGSSNSGILLVANALLFGFVLYYYTKLGKICNKI